MPSRAKGADHAQRIKSPERNVLGFVGIAPVNENLAAMAVKLAQKDVGEWFARMEKLGAMVA